MRNFVLSLCFLTFLLGPCAMFALQKAGYDDLPFWISNESSLYLSGGTANTEVDLSLDSYKSRQFQSACEAYLSNFIPARSLAILWNSAAQREFITISNAFFSWDWYPTYYGSRQIASSDYGFVVTPSPKLTNDTIAMLRNSADQYNSIAAENPNANIFLLIPDCALSSSFSSELRSPIMTRQTIQDYFSNSLDNSIHQVPFGIDDPEEYSRKYFATDHHWNIDGGYDAYVAIASSMGFHGEDLLRKGNALSFDAAFYGTQSRVGLDLSSGPDTIKDYEFDLPDFEVYVNGERTGEGEEYVAHYDRYKRGSFIGTPFADHYGLYFHGDDDVIELISNEKRGLGTLVIAGDSFTNCMERMFLRHFDKVICYTCKLDKSVINRALAEVPDAEAIVIIDNITNVMGSG